MYKQTYEHSIYHPIICTLFTDHDQQMGEEKVTLIVSSLPHDCSMEKVQKYFEQQGKSVSVHSKTMLGSRRAQLELYGFTAQGMPCVCSYMCTCNSLSLSIHIAHHLVSSGGINEDVELCIVRPGTIIWTYTDIKGAIPKKYYVCEN